MLQGHLDKNEGGSAQQAVDEIDRQEEEAATARVLQRHAVDAAGQDDDQVLAQTALLHRRPVRAVPRPRGVFHHSQETVTLIFT